MTSRSTLCIFVAAAVALVAIPGARTDAVPPAGLTLPPLADDPTLPPLPAQADRIANYTIRARLDPVAHMIDGSLVLEWRNTSEVALDRFPFHLYWNAFSNNLSTSARGQGRRAARAQGDERTKARSFGFTRVTKAILLGEAEADLTSTMRYIHPDGGPAEDRTVLEIQTPRPIAPNETARFKLDWHSKIPYGDVGRAGWVHDYNFIVQWFPKIGVFWKGAWNAHEFHAWSEFFADYGVYDVTLTLPKGFVVGATGALQEKKDGPDGTESLRFVQADVHDFAWTASRRYLDRRSRFDDPGYPPVEIRLLLQPEHAHLEQRYVEATKIALRSYGTWSAPYPYPNITVVDPAWMSASGGMEYPTLFTGGASVLAPRELESPESVTIHEAGHQFWYGLVANNEFEEAWLDEGFNSYHDEKAARIAFGPKGWGAKYFGLRTPRRRNPGAYPVVAPGVWIARGEEDRANLRRDGEVDVMARRSWEYRTSGAYTLNSYGKPSLTLQTLENIVGDDTMTRILRTYARRYRFKHPTTEDFIATVNEVTGQDYRWFFEQTWFSNERCDYAVAVKNAAERRLEGYADIDAPGATPTIPAEKPKDDGKKTYEPEVTVRRLGGVTLPVSILIHFSDGSTKVENWNGKDRWTRFRYKGPKVVRAAVDPDAKLTIDVDPTNNTWIDEKGTARRAATKWGARYLFWLQNLLELHAVLG